MNSTDILCAKNNNNQVIQPIYEYLKFQLSFDKYFINQGIFFGLENNYDNSDIELDDQNIYNISQIKGIKYKLTPPEKIKKGTHLKIKIKIYDHNNNPITDFEEFNFFICLKGYQISDLDSSMKCLSEGYYTLDNFSYSCYETCASCDRYNKPHLANYINNYCYFCKLNYPYFVNIKSENNNFYKSCYTQCPNHAPYLKEIDSKECISECPKYKTNDGKCVDNCDFEFYKYLLKNEKTCYNYIPNNYFVYIDDYNEVYDINKKPIIKISDECPNNSYDSSFKKYCINSEQDIYYLIPNPKELIEYNNPLIISLKKKNIIIRAYTSDLDSNDMKKYDNKLFKIDISFCEDLLKQYYKMKKEDPIIIYDINNLNNENYLYKLFSLKGEELDTNICKQKNINLNKISYYSYKELNNTICPKEKPYYELASKKCIKYCDIVHFINRTCITDNINKENIEYNINNIKTSITSHSIDFILDNIMKEKEDIIIEEEGIKYQLTSTSSQNNKIDKNISDIYLGKCEQELKKYYNININDSLLIFKLDINIEGYSIPIVEYEIYHPITKKKLDLNICNNNKINISIPFNISENEIFKYNPKSEFYNDICSIYTTQYNTDITLKDRQNEFINNNMTLCENDCNFISYNYSLKKVNCECDIKFSIKDLYDIKIDKEKLKLKFNIKNLINIKIIKCYKQLFCKNGILYNKGSYILLSIIFIYIIGLFIFISKDYKSLKKEIKNLFINDKNNNNILDNNLVQNKILKKQDKIEKNKKGKRNQTHPSKGQILINEENKKEQRNIIKYNKRAKQNYKNNNTDNYILFNKNNKIPMNDYELNEYEFKDALKHDKRTFLNYFFSLLKNNHLLLFAIIPSQDYNSKIIKFCIFLFSFALELTNNALFFNEETMHNIYVKKGAYDIIYQIPQIIYSSIISSVIDIIIRYFSLSQKYIIEEKNKKEDKKNNSKYKGIIICLKIKFIIFYILSFLLLFSFWYYISCFCAIYKNTQMYLIKDTLIGFGISLIYPIISYLVSGLFRTYALRNNGECIYKFSKFIII